jgi:hypothetical protein
MSYPVGDLLAAKWRAENGGNERATSEEVGGYSALKSLRANQTTRLRRYETELVRSSILSVMQKRRRA